MWKCLMCVSVCVSSGARGWCECVVYGGFVHGLFWCLPAVHSVVKKVAQYMADVLEDSRDKVQENLLANGGTVMLTNSTVWIVLVPKKGLDLLHESYMSYYSFNHL